MSVPEGLRIRIPESDEATSALLGMLERVRDVAGHPLDVDVRVELEDESGARVPVSTRIVLGADARDGEDAPAIQIDEARSHLLLLARGGDGAPGRPGADVDVAVHGLGQALVLVGGRGGQGASASEPSGGPGGAVRVHGGDVEPDGLDVIAAGGHGGHARGMVEVASVVAGPEGNIAESEQGLNGTPGTPGAPGVPTAGNGTAGGVGSCNPGPCDGGDGGDGGLALIQVACAPVTNFITARGGNGGLGGDGGTGGITPAGGNGGRGGHGGNAEAHCRPQHPMTPQRSCRARARAGNGAAGGNGGNSQPGLFPGGNGGVAGNGGDASAMGCCTTAVTSVAIAGNGGVGGTGGRGCDGGHGGCGGRAGWAVTNVVEGTFSGGGAAAASGIGGAGGPGGPGGGAPVCNGGNGGHGGPVALALASSTCGAPAQVQGAAGLGGTAGFGNPAGAPGVAGLSGTPCTAPLGCSDGTEEAYGIANNCPGLSACAGGWSLPGVLGTPVPACGRVSGNSSVNPSGAGCTVSDLCGVGFHVCRNDADIVAHLSPGCVSGSVAGAFYATGQSTNGTIRLATGVNTSLASCNGSTSVCGCAQTMWTANDLAGVGAIGLGTLCAAGGVNRTSGGNCMSLQGANCAVAPTAWQCPSTGFDEAHTVTKGSSSCGGVLCCMDP